MGKTKLALLPILLTIVIVSISTQIAYAGTPPMPGPPNDIHVDWELVPPPTGGTGSTGPIQGPSGFTGDFSIWPLYAGVPTQAQCEAINDSVSACTFQIQNVEDPLPNKIIQFDIVGGPLGLSITLPQVICHDSTGPSSGTLLDESSTRNINNPQPWVNSYWFECEPNPDWEEISLNILTNQINQLSFQVWTQSYGDPDFGDAPEPTYTTSLNPSHLISPLYMGATIDGEPAGQPNAAATGDGVDEDGVSFAGTDFTQNAATSVDVSLTGNTDTALLCIWLDYDSPLDGFQNGAPTSGDQIFCNTVSGNGPHNIPFTMPSNPGDTYMRFRLCETGESCNVPNNTQVNHGEVEDYKITVQASQNNQGPSPPPTVGGTAIPIDTSALLLASAQSMTLWMIPVIAAGIGIGVFIIKKRN